MLPCSAHVGGRAIYHLKKEFVESIYWSDDCMYKLLELDILHPRCCPCLYDNITSLLLVIAKMNNLLYLYLIGTRSPSK